MPKMLRILLGAVGLVAGLGLLHATLNLGFDPFRSETEAAEARARFRVGFLPVT